MTTPVRCWAGAAHAGAAGGRSGGAAGGQGLQRRLICRRMELAAGAALFATAAPGNLPSWHNLLDCGFCVRALQYRYGGHARYLLAYLPHAASPAVQDGRELGDADDLAGQQALLAQAWRAARRSAPRPAACAWEPLAP